MKSFVAVWISAMILLSSLIVLFGCPQVRGESGKETRLYSLHSPIRINSDIDFDTQFPGRVISGYDIDGTGYGYCVYIGNCSQPFTVKDCYLHNASGGGDFPYHYNSGLTLCNVQNGKVDNNDALGNCNGIVLYSSSNNIIANNNASWNYYSFGIFLFSSSNNNIANNNASGNSGEGIILSTFSNNNSVTDNNASGNSGAGIGLAYSSNYNTLVNNNASKNCDGVCLAYSCNNNTLTNNRVSGNSYNDSVTPSGKGIFLIGSSDNSIVDNDVAGNHIDGLCLYQADNRNLITHNRIFGNAKYGINITSLSNPSNPSTGNHIHHNNFSNNDGGGVQAYDDIDTNFWNDTTEGNYWSDWTTPDTNQDNIVDNPYIVDGNAGAQDYYPLVNPISANQPPTAIIDSITPNPAVQGQTVTFTGHGTDPDGSVVAYNWTSNIDGKLNDSATFATSSLSLGTHNITFKVKDDNNTWSQPATQTLTITIPPNQAPTAIIESIAPSPAYLGQPVRFIGLGIDPDGTIIEYNWTSNLDGRLNDTSSFTTSKLSIGPHTIRFSVKDNNDTWSQEVTRTLIVTLNHAPTSCIDSISPNPVIEGQNVTLKGHGNDTDGTLTGYQWRSSIDGILNTSANFTTSHLSPGAHNIYLKVKDDNCTWSQEVEASLTVIKAEPDLTIAPADIQFSNQYPAPGERVTVTVRLRNIGTADADSADVKFYEGDPTTGGSLLEGKSGVAVKAGGFTDVSMVWIANIGSHEIWVKVGPTKPQEGNTTNNVAMKKITVEWKEEERNLMPFYALIILMVIVIILALLYPYIKNRLAPKKPERKVVVRVKPRPRPRRALPARVVRLEEAEDEGAREKEELEEETEVRKGKKLHERKALPSKKKKVAR